MMGSGQYKNVSASNAELNPNRMTYYIMTRICSSTLDESQEFFSRLLLSAEAA